MLRKTLLAGLVLVAASINVLLAPPARAIETVATHAYILDTSTNTVLMDKNGDVPIPPASMSKLMTVYILLERLKSGTLSMDDKFPVSEKAWRTGGSKMFVRVGDRVSIRDLLQGIIVQSGNDACIVVAQGIAGTVSAFVDLMNETAKKLGLTESHFVNPDGLPTPPGQRMSAHDLAILSQAIIAQFPEYYSIFKQKNFTYNNIRQGNRNPLLYHDTLGADGLKTGHTEAAGYCLIASAKRDGRRVIAVLAGMKSEQERADEGRKMIAWALTAFNDYSFFKKGEAVSSANVWLGRDKTVPLVIQRDLRLTLLKSARVGMKMTVKLKEPVPAPISKGQQLATLTVTAPVRGEIGLDRNAGSAVLSNSESRETPPR